MRLLLDSHTLFWCLLERSRLSNAATAAITAEGSEIYVSVASAWEIAIIERLTLVTADAKLGALGAPVLW